MREETEFISERIFMQAIGGQLFAQAPNNEPRKVSIIMNAVRDAFRADAYNDNNYYSLRIKPTKLYKYIETLLMKIPEFVELNLSQDEFEKNIDVNDESRPKYSFESAFSHIPWRNDFIDLTAFIRNVTNNIFILKESQMDCFCCKYSNNKNVEMCSTCRLNPNYKINYEGNIEVKGNYTFACKFVCYKSKYICCEECHDSNSCTKKCDGKSDTCGNSLYKGDN